MLGVNRVMASPFQSNRDIVSARLFFGLAPGCAPLSLRANLKHYSRHASGATGVQRDKRRSRIDKSTAQFPLRLSLTLASENGICIWRADISGRAESASITSEARGHLTATAAYQAARGQIDRSKSLPIASIFLFQYKP